MSERQPRQPSPEGNGHGSPEGGSEKVIKAGPYTFKGEDLTGISVSYDEATEHLEVKVHGVAVNITETGINEYTVTPQTVEELQIGRKELIAESERIKVDLTKTIEEAAMAAENAGDLDRAQELRNSLPQKLNDLDDKLSKQLELIEKHIQAARDKGL